MMWAPSRMRMAICASAAAPRTLQPLAAPPDRRPRLAISVSVALRKGPPIKSCRVLSRRRVPRTLVLSCLRTGRIAVVGNRVRKTTPEVLQHIAIFSLSDRTRYRAHPPVDEHASAFRSIQTRIMLTGLSCAPVDRRAHHLFPAFGPREVDVVEHGGGRPDIWKLTSSETYISGTAGVSALGASPARHAPAKIDAHHAFLAPAAPLICPVGYALARSGP